MGDGANPIRAVVTDPDIMASNGVVHIIDAVLVPQAVLQAVPASIDNNINSGSNEGSSSNHIIVIVILIIVATVVVSVLALIYVRRPASETSDRTTAFSNPSYGYKNTQDEFIEDDDEDVMVDPTNPYAQTYGADHDEHDFGGESNTDYLLVDDDSYA